MNLQLTNDEAVAVYVALLEKSTALRKRTYRLENNLTEKLFKEAETLERIAEHIYETMSNPGQTTL